MADKNPKSSFADFDQEDELTVQQQINQSYQSGVVDYLDQSKPKTAVEDDETLQ